MEKILVTGGSGLLGSNVAKIASADYKVCGVYWKNKVSIKGVDFVQADLTNKEDVENLKGYCPDYIVNCAALINMDYCEEHAKQAYRENVLSAGLVASAAEELDARLIHISTDAVFDGLKGDYNEGDTANPISVYGKTKLEAEKEVLDACPGSCVVRTNIHGWNKIEKNSLSEWMIDKLKKKEELPGFEDAYFSPIFANDLASALLILLEKDCKGVLHVSGREPCSKLSFARIIAEVFDLDDSFIRPVKMEDVKLKAPRGRNMSLNVSKAEKILGRILPNAKEGLEHMKEAYDRGYVKELKDG